MREVKREALIRDLRKYAKEKGLPFEVDKTKGKGSHYRVRLGDKVTTVQSGELSPFHIKRIREQLLPSPAK